MSVGFTSLEKLSIYEASVRTLRKLKLQHKLLIKKAREKTITREETIELRELVKVHNKLEKLIKEIENKIF